MSSQISTRGAQESSGAREGATALKHPTELLFLESRLLFLPPDLSFTHFSLLLRSLLLHPPWISPLCRGKRSERSSPARWAWTRPSSVGSPAAFTPSHSLATLSRPSRWILPTLIPSCVAGRRRASPPRLRVRPPLSTGPSSPGPPRRLAQALTSDLLLWGTRPSAILAAMPRTRVIVSPGSGRLASAHARH